MLRPVRFLFGAVFIYCSACVFVVQANLLADCTFGEVQSSIAVQNMSFSGQLPSSRNMSHYCQIKTDNPDGLLYLRAKRNDELKEGSLYVSVYGSDKAPILLGHLDIPKSSVGWNSLAICPSSSKTKASIKFVTFTGTPGLNFTVEFAEKETVKIGKQKEITVSPWNRVGVFQFIPTAEDMSDTQLDVTVTSESADVPAYLKVSRDCKDVKDNIDDVDYKGESLRLSFAKKGRITLSKFSTPPLTDSTTRWFIGIAIKNIEGTLPFDATKVVTVELTKSFHYSYAAPLWISAFLISFIFGVVVSLWAWYCFRENIDSQCSIAEEVTWSNFFLAMKDIICHYSFGRGPKTYSYITLIAGSVLTVGALQFVVADWYLMIHEGDRDHCYYNDFCYRVRYADIPYNLMVSNLTFFIHGLILAVNVWCMESQLLARCRKLAANAKVRDSDDRDAVMRPLRLDRDSFDQTRIFENVDARKIDDAKSEQTRPDQNTKSELSVSQSNKRRRRQRYKTEEVDDAEIQDDRELDQTRIYGNVPLKNKRPPELPRHDKLDQTRIHENVPPLPPKNNRPPELSRDALKRPDISPRGEAKGRHDKSTRTTEDWNQPPSNKEYAELPSHVLNCPDITLHLEKMRVPHFTIKDDDVVKIFAEARKKKFSFTIGYAFAWALIFEGLFSSLYHLCPSRLTYQFDTAFMFVIAGLTTVLIYNGIEMQECSPNLKAKSRVAAANFFLYVLTPLFIFNYLGTVYHSEPGLSIAVKIPFFVFLGLWCVCVAVWAGCKLWKEASRDEPNGARSKTKKSCKFIILVTLYILGLLVPVVLLILLSINIINFPDAFLYTCIIESSLFKVGKVCIDINNFEDRDDKRKTPFSGEIFVHDVLQITYILAVAGVWITALVFFFGKETTDKLKSPEKSRDLNQPCYFLDFFDFHDMWHIFSSFTLLMTTLLAIHISYGLPRESGVWGTPIAIRWKRYLHEWCG